LLNELRCLEKRIMILKKFSFLFIFSDLQTTYQYDGMGYYRATIYILPKYPKALKFPKCQTIMQDGSL